MENIEDMEDLEKLREKEFAEKAQKIQNTISLFRKAVCMLAMIVAAFIFFTCGRIITIMQGASL